MNKVQGGLISMKGIYLGAYLAQHPGYDIVYQDINGMRDLPGDMACIDLSPYDYVIATPPCNWWSRANYRRNESNYALNTKYLLPLMIYMLYWINKPFIVENVRNDKLFKQYHLFDLGLFVYRIGRHTYWSNICIPQLYFLKQHAITDVINGKVRYLSSQNLSRSDRQGGKEVHEVIEIWLRFIHDKK